MGNENDEQGVRERIRAQVLEATSEDDLKRIRQGLKDQGEKEGSINAVVSELRKKGHLQFNKTTAITKSLPVEAIVENLPWPVDVDGHVDGAFVAGMRYEALNVIRGIKLAQELTKMGIDQATPVIKMAQEMRQSEGQAAQVLASQFAQASIENNKTILEAIKAQGIASSPNPLLSKLTDAMWPYFAQYLGNFMAAFQPKQPGGQPQQPAQPGAPAPTPQPTFQPPGRRQVSNEEVKEAFGDD